jgi:hypothetical protein
MSALSTPPRYKVGDQVRIKIPSRWVGMVSEVRYTPSGSGRVLYRVRVPLDPEPLWMVLAENEVEDP